MPGVSRHLPPLYAAVTLILVLAGADAHAARPMVVDDARLVDPGAYQLQNLAAF